MPNRNIDLGSSPVNEAVNNLAKLAADELSCGAVNTAWSVLSPVSHLPNDLVYQAPLFRWRD